ncbi:MAG: inorganic phosphate transporter [Pseudomonadota bacterium]
MGLQLCYVVVGMLLLFAVFDLIVGVTNDAVNFLNSALGSKAAPFFVIMTIASLGILAGVTFSGGMMEVARKGIFHPQFFTMPDLLTIFLAVMITDVLLLDLFNTHGLPTSTTVSIVFELLGAAVALSVIKIMAATQGPAMELWDYINTAKAMAIVGGILLSIVVAFFSGAVMQFISRLIFTFEYSSTIKKYGALWGGMAMTAITFFILVKGAKGATFMDAVTVDWIKNNSLTIMGGIFVVTAVIFQFLITLFNINIFKPIVLIGTFALAMAFAANDLVNFIGVPLAGLNSLQNALASADPLNVTMAALSKKVHSQTYIMLISGAIMVITLWISKKARTVTETEIKLGQQDEGAEKFESIWLSRKIVNLFDFLFSIVNNLTPEKIKQTIARRMEPIAETAVSHTEKPSFDLVRAAVNLMVASAVVSFATSLKLPLSTTYVTFMVAMGSSFSDQAWGRESAVYRVTGVLTVIGGWFMTAFIAFVISYAFANILFYLKIPGFILLCAFSGFMIWKNHHKHKANEKDNEEMSIYNLQTVENFTESVSETFDHLAFLLKGIRESLDTAFDALFKEDLYTLRNERNRVKHFQKSTNIIIANIFKVLRLLSREDQKVSFNYYQIIRRLQKLTDGHRDVVIRSSMHISNRHTGLLNVQIEELKEIKKVFLNIILQVETAFRDKQIVDCQDAVEQFHYLRELVDTFNENQIKRIRDDSSKTRLSILFYAISGNCVMMAKQNVKLLDIFNESFKLNQKCS